MSRLRYIVVVIILGMLMCLDMQVFAYEFMDEAAFTKRAGYDPIPIKKGEKVLASPKGYQVSSIVFLFMAPHDQVVKELKGVATEQFGEQSGKDGHPHRRGYRCRSLSARLSAPSPLHLRTIRF